MLFHIQPQETWDEWDNSPIFLRPHKRDQFMAKITHVNIRHTKASPIAGVTLRPPLPSGDGGTFVEGLHVKDLYYDDFTNTDGFTQHANQLQDYIKQIGVKSDNLKRQYREMQSTILMSMNDDTEWNWRNDVKRNAYFSHFQSNKDLHDAMPKLVHFLMKHMKDFIRQGHVRSASVKEALEFRIEEDN